MSIRRVEIGRFSMPSSKPFESVLAKVAVGRLDILVEFMQVSREAKTFAELENIIRRDTGRTGMLLFVGPMPICASIVRCRSAPPTSQTPQPFRPATAAHNRCWRQCSPCSLREATRCCDRVSYGYITLL